MLQRKISEEDVLLTTMHIPHHDHQTILVDPYHIDSEHVQVQPILRDAVVTRLGSAKREVADPHKPEDRSLVIFLSSLKHTYPK
jgi:hypothetical protein